MTLFKSNGDPLQGTISPPTWYPNPANSNVNFQSIDWAYRSFVVAGVPQQVTLTGQSWQFADHETATVSLSWLPSDHAVTYAIYGNGVWLDQVSDAHADISDLVIDTVYQFTVTALTDDGRESAPSAVLSVFSDD